MRNIAILGGSFNPFHNGHENMVKAAFKSLNVDEVWLMPAKKPPHKASFNYASDEDRRHMLLNYAQTNERVVVEDLELNLEGFTYTAITLPLLRKKYNNCKFTFLIGGDSIENFHKWYEPETIVKNADIGICVRDDVDRSRVEEIVNSLKSTIGGEYHILDFDICDVSSTMVRDKVKNGEDISDLVPAPIKDYILSHNLYKEDQTYDIEYLTKAMEETLKPHRYKHSIGVMNTAAELAKIYNVEINKAKTAGILHDCAKHVPVDEMVNLIIQNDVQLNDNELIDDTTKASLLHSKAGSILAKNIYNIKDEDILNSIFYHTVGRPAMSMLEKIIFVADFIEPNRTQECNPSLEVLRELVKTDIDKVIYLISENTINYLEASGRCIDKQTLDTRDYYKNLCGVD